MHPFSTPWKNGGGGVQKGCIGNEWVKRDEGSRIKITSGSKDRAKDCPQTPL